MEVETIIQIISTVGFPIAMCIALVFQGVKILESLQNEIKDLKTTINNSNLVMQRILDKLGVDEDVELK